MLSKSYPCHLTAVLFFTAFAIIIAGIACADAPEVKVEDGHAMPLVVRITYLDGKTQSGLLCQCKTSTYSFCSIRHTQTTKSPQGGKVVLWWDTVALIKDTAENEALFVFRNGRERRLGFSSLYLIIIDDIGMVDSVPIQKVEMVEVLKPPRTDGKGQPMSDLWQYSPYTGEKLPALE